MHTKSPHPDDIAIGGRIKAARRQAGISQERLGEACGGITFQQVQKYEKGTNRVAGSRLIQIAQALRVPVADLTGEGAGASALTEIRGLSRTALRAAETIDRMPPAVGRALAGLVEKIAAAADFGLVEVVPAPERVAAE